MTNNNFKLINNQKVLLSICMIVKNEEKVLKRCLDSLAPLMEAFPCELLITDTGSTDSTVEIARNYTDKVSHFEWRDDFSAARNVAIEQAKGTWVMIFDADMWFEDTSPIIDLLNKNYLNKYKAVAIICRNLVNTEAGKTETDSELIFLYKNSPYLRFEGKIHEAISINRQDLYAVNAICYHSGYQYENDEERNIKQERNWVGLQEEYKKNPNDLRLIVHILMHLQINSKLHENQEYVSKAIKLLNKNPKNPYFASVYNKVCQYYQSIDNYYEAAKIVEEFLKLKGDDNAENIDFYYFNAFNYQKLNDLDKAIGYHEKYLETYEKTVSKVFEKAHSFIYATERADDITYNNFKINLFVCYLRKCDEKKAIETLITIDLSRTLPGNIVYMANNILNYITNNEKYDILTPIIETFFDSDNKTGESKSDYILSILEDYLKIYPKSKLLIAEQFMCNSQKHPYVLLQKLRVYDNQENKEKVMEILEIISGIVLKKDYILSDFLFYSMKYLKDFSEIFEVLENYNTGKLCNEIIEKHINNLQIITNFVKNKIYNQLSLKEKVLYSLLLEQILIHSNMVTKNVAILTLEVYCEVTKILLNDVYLSNTLNDDKIVLIPEGYRFAYYANKAIQARAFGDNVQTLKYLKAGVLCYPPMKSIVDIILEDIEDQAESQVRNEFEAFAVQVKAKINELLNAGMKEEVRSLIETYEKVNPMDEDINFLKQKSGMLN